MYEEFLRVAIQAAHAAGKLQLEGLERELHIETKRSPIDFVTEVDRACEVEVARQIEENFPGHQFLGEEGTTGGNNPDYRWIVDPLDGTTNYTHHYPHFCVSIGLEYQSQLIVGVVYDAVRNEFFSATAGGGAFLNDRPIRVSTAPSLAKALVCTGFPGDQAGNQQVLTAWEKISLRCHGIRRDGSAALDLCYVAAGRLDGFWERLNAWDMAAGALLIREAGGVVTNFVGQEFELYKREIVASNGPVGAELVECLGA